jgi:hypothetical protein
MPPVRPTRINSCSAAGVPEAISSRSTAHPAARVAADDQPEDPMTPEPDALRAHVIDLLRGGHAHATFDDAVRDLPAKLRGKVPRGLPYSAWQLVEHMRLTQEDILQFSRNYDRSYESPEWPEGYWPSLAEPLDEDDWDASIKGFRADREAIEALVRDPAQDLFAPFPWGEGQTLLREALLVADHTSYHLGQLVVVRRLLGAWPE